MKTVIVTINTPGSQTGPNFNIFSNVDLVTPLVSSVAKSSLLSGYSVTTVPDAATSIRVKSIGTCTTYVDLSIVTPTTTTTTTVACTTVIYGYGVDQGSACQAYIDYPEAFQYNGIKLYIDNPSDPCGPGSVVAGNGYYSDGTDIYYWDGTTFTFDSTCGLYSLQTLTFYAKRQSGTISTANNKADIYVSTDGGSTWTSAWTATSHALSTTSVIVGQFQVFSGTSVMIGVLGTGGYINVKFGVGSGTISYEYCGTYSSYNYGTVYADAAVYLQLPLNNTGYQGYIACP
jgi:hypothetical protein